MHGRGVSKGGRGLPGEGFPWGVSGTFFAMSCMPGIMLTRWRSLSSLTSPTEMARSYQYRLALHSSAKHVASRQPIAFVTSRTIPAAFLESFSEITSWLGLSGLVRATCTTSRKFLSCNGAQRVRSPGRPSPAPRPGIDGCCCLSPPARAPSELPRRPAPSRADRPGAAAAARPWRRRSSGALPVLARLPKPTDGPGVATADPPAPLLLPPPPPLPLPNPVLAPIRGEALLGPLARLLAAGRVSRPPRGMGGLRLLTSPAAPDADRRPPGSSEALTAAGAPERRLKLSASLTSSGGPASAG